MKCLCCKKPIEHANLCEDCYQDAVKVLATKDRHEDEW